ncbi:bifunctional 3-(3-hydroxy-phenyl)propionate/3-hydroxycinnamic acid hydroxylase MhpA [Mycolicibacterium sp. CBM1]
MSAPALDEDLDLDVDVVVVGAGPVGLIASLKLAQLGWRVCCVERQPSAYGRPRAVGLDSESMRTLQSIGVAEDQLAISGVAGSYIWYNASGEVLLKFPPPVGLSGWPTVNICQPDTEALLSRHADNTASITLTRGVEVVTVREDADGVSVDLRRTGTEESAGSVRGRYVVGCDGAHSTVREHLGTRIDDQGFFYDWYIVDVILDQDTGLGTDMLQVCSPARPTTLVAGGPGRRRWEFMLLPGETKEAIDTEDNAWQLLETWGVNPGNARIERRAVYTFQARFADSWNRGRSLIAGDAAHQVPPFAAQGLNSGVRDVANLSWKLDLVLRGVSPQSLLDTYTVERREHVRHAIELSVELGKVICILDEAQAAERDRAMLPFAGDPAAALPVVSEPRYVRGVVSRDDSGASVPPAGTLTPQFQVRGHTGTGLFDDVCGSGSTLLALSQPALEPALAQRFSDIGGRVVVLRAPGSTLEQDNEVEDLTGGYTKELQRLGAAATLHRPDGYYFGSSATTDVVADLVEEFVRAVTGTEDRSTQAQISGTSGNE